MAELRFLQRFQAMVASLQDNHALRVVTAEFNQPATAAELNEARHRFNLTEVMESFYSEVNGLTIQWERSEGKALPDGGLVAGSIDLLPVQEVFGDWEDVIYFEKNDQFQLLYPFDFFVPEACAALYLDGSENPAVYYHYLGEEMISLGLSFGTYLELLLKSRGYWYWQMAVATSQSQGALTTISVEEKNFWRMMPQLFSDFDEADFKRLTRSNHRT
ncbi:hypothetical protein GC175_04100 [bacterium]|nr:hypothetical protein [bacterium]